MVSLALVLLLHGSIGNGKRLPVSISLASGSISVAGFSTATNQTNGSQKTQIVDSMLQIEQLESEVNSLKAGGSNMAMQNNTKIAVLEAKVQQNTDANLEMKTRQFEIVTFIIVQLVGVAGFGLKQYVDGKKK